VAASQPAVVAQPPAVGTQITFAGTVDGSAATLAIAIKDGKAVAYLCDGKTAEAWLKGTATSGQLNLTGASEAKLTGTFGENTAAGDVSAAGKQFTFSIKPVTEPSGLYRSTANVRNAQLVGGWIVLPNGKQVGLAKLDGNTIAVPPLDTTSKSATVDGVTVSAGRLDGTGL
jgi:serine/threonine-protein kinase